MGLIRGSERFNAPVIQLMSYYDGDYPRGGLHPGSMLINNAIYIQGEKIMKHTIFVNMIGVICISLLLDWRGGTRKWVLRNGRVL